MTPPAVPYDLVALTAAADAACAAACEARVADAYNAADLHCFDAGCEYGADGVPHYYVRLEEAAPGARLLQQFVSAHLAALGYVGVEVRTEW